MHDVDEALRFAILNKRLLEVRYQGRNRVVEPHDYGVQGGIARVLVYQHSGPARPHHSAIGWRLFNVSKIETVEVLEEGFRGSRSSSSQHHHVWDVIYLRVS